MEQPTTPRAWAKALARFEAGYGDSPDFSDATDVAAYLAILLEVVSEDGGLVDGRTVDAMLAHQRAALLPVAVQLGVRLAMEPLALPMDDGLREASERYLDAVLPGWRDGDAERSATEIARRTIEEATDEAG